MSRPINFTDTSVTKKPYVEIDGIEYEVQDGTYEGGTDLNANTFNKMQDELNPFRNLFSTHLIQMNTDYRATADFVKVKSNTTYIFSSKDNNVAFEGNLEFYNANQERQSQIFIFNTPFTTPDYCEYIRVIFTNANAPLDAKIQLEKGTTPTSYVPYIPYNVENAICGTAWKDITCQGTYSNFDANNYDKFQYKQIGNQVFLRGLLKNSSVPADASYAVAGTIPQNLSPKNTAYFMAATQSTNPIECSVSQYGEVRLLNKEANTWISINGISFFID